MLSALIIAAVALFGTVAFNFSYAISGAESAYLGLYKGIVEKNVFVVGNGDAYAAHPYFDLAGLRTDLDDYLTMNLKPYCRDYAFEVTGKDRQGDGYIDAVRIQLDVTLTLTYAKEYCAVFALERKESV